MARATLSEVVAKARLVHGDTYNYTELSLGVRPILTVVCAEHGEFLQNASNHLTGKGCQKCAAKRLGKSLKYTLTTATEAAYKVHTEGNYTYLSLDRANKSPTLTINCKLHGQFTQDLYNHLAGKGCPSCADARVADTFEVVVLKSRVVHGDTYEYLSYDSSVRPTRLTINCKQHGQFSQERNVHIQGSGCPACGTGNLSELRRLTIPEVMEKAKKLQLSSYKPLSLQFEKGRTFITLVCATHGEFTKATDAYIRGQGCPKCSYALKAENATTSLLEYIEKAQVAHPGLYKYLALDRTNISYPKVHIECPTHGVFWQGMAQHLSGNKCPICVGVTSGSGTEFADYICSLDSGAKKEVVLEGSKARWDVVVFKASLAFEFHGLYWHSEEHKTKGYHEVKHQRGLDAGFRTIHIFEDEWLLRRTAVESLIKTVLNLNTAKVFARKTQVVEVSKLEADKFMNKYHIQGATSGSKYLGLTAGVKLVAVLGYALRESGRGKIGSTTQAEVTRYATTTSVVGGFSKLLTALKTKHHELKKLYTFSDIRVFTGKLYETTGFKVCAKLRPDYFYVRYGKRQHKCTLQKSNFKRDPRLLYDPMLTESELAQLNQFYKVYDCGKLKWELTL